MWLKKIISILLIHLFSLSGPALYNIGNSIQASGLTATTTIVKTATSSPLTKKATQKVIKTEKTSAKVETKSNIPKSATSTPAEIEPPQPDFATINAYARSAIVNILCTTKGNDLSPISGTGTIVTPDGLILTNAHIGQYLLLKDFKEKDYVSCTIRTGSPAIQKYNAELVYISPIWVQNNKALLKESEPKGTGEDDFAFLKITSRADGTKLESLPYLIMDVRENISINEPVLLAAYPAGFLGGLFVLEGLNMTSSITSIKEIYTFKDNTVDLISVPGTIVSQKGSSGGAVVDKYMTLIGLISTSSDQNNTSDRALNAITVAYINREMTNELGINLQSFVSGDLQSFSDEFNKSTAPRLTKTITEAISKN